MIRIVLIVLFVVVVIVLIVAVSASKKDNGSISHGMPHQGSARNEPAEPAKPVAPKGPAGASAPLRRADYMEHGAELPYFEDCVRVQLVEIADWLALVTDDMQVVNPRSTQLYKVGIHSFGIRGTSYHEEAVTVGDFSPGTTLTLVREPDNAFDPNAVAIYAPGATAKAGYVNKLQARRLALKLDRGDDLVAISLRGDSPGTFDIVPHVLVADRELVNQLRGDGV